MTISKPNHTGSYLKYVIAVLGIILVVLCFALYREYRTLRRSQIMRDHTSFLNTLRGRGPLSPENSGIIQGWMTFDYINRIFNLQPYYLKTKLGISDPHYPRVSLNRCASNQHITATVFLAVVQNAVRTYSTSTVPSATK